MELYSSAQYEGMSSSEVSTHRNNMFMFTMGPDFTVIELFLI